MSAVNLEGFRILHSTTISNKPPILAELGVDNVLATAAERVPSMPLAARALLMGLLAAGAVWGVRRQGIAARR